jgi:hypothetical protein
MLSRIFALVLSAVTIACWSGSPAFAQQTEPRLALVVGNAGYRPGALPTALNDAGLVAEALRSVGFQIVEGADLSQPDMLRLFRDFLAKVDASGPDALAFVYFSGHGLSFEGENYLLGADARLAREADIPIEGVRLSDLLRPLADAPARAKVVMIDAARPLPFRPQGGGLAPGLEAMEAPQGMLIAYSSAPGTVAPDGNGPYGAYAIAIAEMLRAPGIDLETAFTHIRSRTHLSTQGQQTPWHVSNLGDEIELVPPEAAVADLPPPPPRRVVRPMRELEPDDAYALAIETDTLDGYVTFVEVYPRHPYAERIWAMIRARREALAWMRAQQINTPQAYWTYRRRYPDGLYRFDAERRLRRLGAPFAPPSGFAMLPFAGVPLALRGEPREYRPVYRVGPPPPARLLLRPPPSFLVGLPPPAPRAGPRRLPSLSAPIPTVPRLAPAPRRGPAAIGRPPAGTPPAGAASRDAVTTPGVVPRGPVAPGTVAPSTVTPGTVTPSTVTPSTVTPGTVAPSTVTPGTVAPGTVAPGQRRPPAVGQPPAGAPPAGSAIRTPPAPPVTTGPKGPTAVTPPASMPPARAVTPPPGQPRQPGAGGSPGGSPPPGGPSVRPSAPPPAAGRTISAPPAAVGRPTPPTPPPTVRSPPPPPSAKLTPPSKPTPPPPPRVTTPPPARMATPPRSAPAPATVSKPATPPAGAAAKPQACPAGKTLKNVGGRQVCG